MAILFESRRPSQEIEWFALHGSCPIEPTRVSGGGGDGDGGHGGGGGGGSDSVYKWVAQKWFKDCPEAPEWDDALVGVWPYLGQPDGMRTDRAPDASKVLPPLRSLLAEQSRDRVKGVGDTPGGRLSRLFAKSGGFTICGWFARRPTHGRDRDHADGGSDDAAGSSGGTWLEVHVAQSHSDLSTTNRTFGVRVSNEEGQEGVLEISLGDADHILARIPVHGQLLTAEQGRYVCDIAGHKIVGI